MAQAPWASAAAPETCSSVLSSSSHMVRAWVCWWYRCVQVYKGATTGADVAHGVQRR